MLKAQSPVSSNNNALSHNNKLPLRVYKYRLLGMSLSGLAIAAVLYENQSGLIYWLWWLISCYVWPHVALLTAKNSRKPYFAERRNLLFDSFLVGTWVAMIWFNLLPAIIVMLTVTADKVNSGIRKLWLYSLPYLVVGVLLGAVLTGFSFKPETSMMVITASLPIMIIHIIFISLGNSTLVRKVQFQNISLKEMSRRDPLTQLFNHRYWQEQVTQLLQDEARQSEPKTLILIDIDRFKQINDQYGHSAGDDVLRAIGIIITYNLPDHVIAGRLGGDEFAIATTSCKETALQYATQIRDQVALLTFANTPGLSCTVSIGIAENRNVVVELRPWFDSADKALYQAKNTGRNQVLSIETELKDSK